MSLFSMITTNDCRRLQNAELPMSKHIPISYLKSPEYFVTRNGQLGTTLLIQGIDVDLKTDNHVNLLQQCWHDCVLLGGHEVAIYVHTHRHKIESELSGNFNCNFAKSLNQKYFEQFSLTNHFQNSIYITLVYRGIRSGAIGKGARFGKWLSSKSVKQSRELSLNYQQNSLQECVGHYFSQLNQFSPRQLSEIDGRPELLRFLGMLINHGKYRDYIYPHQNIATYIPSSRIYFGRAIEWDANSKQYAAMLSLKQYGNNSSSVMFDKLYQQDCELISTHIFLPEDKQSADSAIARQQRKLSHNNDPAVSQIEALESARDELISDNLIFGHHYHSICVFADDLTILDEQVYAISSNYTEVGCVVVRESIGQEPAFWSQIPGNFSYLPRRARVSSRNFVDFCPLHNYPKGEFNKNHLGGAVTMLTTQAKTPYYFNFHVSGNHE